MDSFRFDIVRHIEPTGDTIENSGAAAIDNRMLAASGIRDQHKSHLRHNLRIFL
jgi:hypothetical protein